MKFILFIFIIMLPVSSVFAGEAATTQNTIYDQATQEILSASQFTAKQGQLVTKEMLVKAEEGAISGLEIFRQELISANTLQQKQNVGSYVTKTGAIVVGIPVIVSSAIASGLLAARYLGHVVNIPWGRTGNLYGKELDPYDPLFEQPINEGYRWPWGTPKEWKPTYRRAYLIRYLIGKDNFMAHGNIFRKASIDESNMYFLDFLFYSPTLAANYLYRAVAFSDVAVAAVAMGAVGVIAGANVVTLIIPHQNYQLIIDSIDSQISSLKDDIAFAK